MKSYGKIKKYFDDIDENESLKESLLAESLNWINNRIFQIIKSKDEIKGYNVQEETEFDDGASKQIATILSENNITSSVSRGQIYQFFYEPKTNVEYYDEFPLTLVLERYKNGFLGVNFHYLDLEYRFAFMSQLWDHVLSDFENNMTDETLINLNYKSIKSLKGKRFYKPCLKRYLYSQLKSPLYRIHPKHWIYAMMLPTGRFFTKDNIQLINRIVYLDSKIKVINNK